jgi:hypothetical protein
VPLTVEEIAPGIVAYLCPRTLMSDLRVARDYSYSDCKESRPYLCVSLDDDDSTWLPLTSQNPYGCRLPIELEWRTGGGARWQSADTFIRTFAHEFSGPRSAFALASCVTDLWSHAGRPGISADGLRVVLAIRQAKIHKAELAALERASVGAIAGVPDLTP